MDWRQCLRTSRERLIPRYPPASNLGRRLVSTERDSSHADCAVGPLAAPQRLPSRVRRTVNADDACVHDGGALPLTNTCTETIQS